MIIENSEDDQTDPLCFLLVTLQILRSRLGFYPLYDPAVGIDVDRCRVLTITTQFAHLLHWPGDTQCCTRVQMNINTL